MTALEAMYYGKPVIVPPVGGIVELVENNISGFCADAQNINGIISRIQCLANNKIAYGRMSVAALERARHFTQATFRDNIIMTIQSLTRESNKEIYAFANI
jgi:glycosyltransferase involved in cell wall biosynthesis